MNVLWICLVSTVFSTTVVAGASLSVQDPTVTVEYNRKSDFSRFSTYHWMESQKPLKNLANHIRITRALQNEMKELGFTIDTAKPQLRVLYRLETKKKLDTTSRQRQSTWDPTNIKTEVDFGRKELGTLTIELYDAETNVRLWRASVTEILGTPDKAEKQINRVVGRLFEKYPSRAAEIAK